MHITVLYVVDCPHVGLARHRIAEALDRVGVVVSSTETVVHTADDAATGFHGSPTILVDGADPFTADVAAGLTCRLYPTENGLQGAPSVDQLVEVFTR